MEIYSKRNSLAGEIVLTFCPIYINYIKFTSNSCSITSPIVYLVNIYPFMLIHKRVSIKETLANNLDPDQTPQV